MKKVAKMNRSVWNINVMLKLNTRWAMTYTLNMKCDYDRCAHDTNTNKVFRIQCNREIVCSWCDDTNSNNWGRWRRRGFFHPQLRIRTHNLQFFVMFGIENEVLFGIFIRIISPGLPLFQRCVNSIYASAVVSVLFSVCGYASYFHSKPQSLMHSDVFFKTHSCILIAVMFVCVRVNICLCISFGTFDAE